MKFCLFAILGVFAILSTSAQTKPADAATTLKQFYTSYITAVSKGEDAKLKPLQKQYCTVNLLAKIPKLARQHDEDPFLKAQDSDTKWLQTLSVQKDEKKEGHYLVSYQADSKIVVNLTLIRADGNYKIDNVW